jgi:putative flippase GtrA
MNTVFHRTCNRVYRGQIIPDANRYLVLFPVGCSAMKQIHKYLSKSILNCIDLFYKPFNKWISLQSFRYIACGGFNTAFDIFLFSVSYHLVFKKQNVTFGLFTMSPHVAALIFAFSISFCSGFYLSRHVVFPQSGLSATGQMSRLLLVSILAITLNYLFLTVLVDYCGIYPTAAKITTSGCVALLSYLSQTYFFFRPKHSTERISPPSAY